VHLDGSTIDGWMHNDGAFSSRFGGFPVYTRVAFDTAPEELGLWNEDGLSTTLIDAEGIDLGAWARFPAGTETVVARVGVSFVDAEGAAANLAEELGDADFDAIHTRARDEWNELLGKTEIWNAGEDEAAMVATSIYHAHLMPTLISDADGRSRDTAGNIVAGSHPRYSDFSLWDTYRTLHSWLMLSEHPINAEFVRSLLAFGEMAGAVPRWSLAHSDVHSMIGSPGEIVLAESAAKGIAFDDEEAAYQIARVTAFGPAPGDIGGRDAIEDYLAHGYVPADATNGSVSQTQEFAIADGALAAWAARLGHADDAAELGAHALSYRQLYDGETGFFRGRNRDGSLTPWQGDVAAASDYTEGDAWQYLWLAPHDPEGLAETLGGRDAALARLRTFFEASAVEEPVLGHRTYYWHGNEPGLHTPWLFAIWGSRDESARWTRWATDTFYGTGPDGLPGNDDSGTMSAWLLFASAGLYPIAGFDHYVVGVPRFARVALHRPGGDLVVECDADPRTHPIVVSITLDGAPVDGAYLTHAQLTGTHTLRFSLARQP
jgi:predicted alpha-1,2-mannosidase